MPRKTGEAGRNAKVSRARIDSFKNLNGMWFNGTLFRGLFYGDDNWRGRRVAPSRLRLLRSRTLRGSGTIFVKTYAKEVENDSLAYAQNLPKDKSNPEGVRIHAFSSRLRRHTSRSYSGRTVPLFFVSGRGQGVDLALPGHVEPAGIRFALRWRSAHQSLSPLAVSGLPEPVGPSLQAAQAGTNRIAPLPRS